MFCLIKGLERDGYGKVVSSEGEIWSVEFFDSPAKDGRKIRRVSQSLVVPKRLGKNTRVHAYDELNDHWQVGRVIEDDGEGLSVRFAHKVDVYLLYESVFVRWNNLIENPTVFLANYVTETPQYAEARAQFLESYIAQRGAAGGLSSLLSSSIELESHQIDVVRRILNDPSQRYLLADEVGLGKTIEAGIVIRQAVLDDPTGHRVVVLAPESLVKQWRQELAVRFGLRSFMDESVFVLPHDTGTEQREALLSATMLVIDEAHHVAEPSSGAHAEHLYEMVRKAAIRTERVLLLSATPILRNEAGFLRMLHLLDPVVYPLHDYESFRLRIAHRQALAEVVASLLPENALFMEASLDDLLTRIPDDPRLHELTRDVKEHLAGIPDEDDPDLIDSIRRLRAHISETYRLNRRILRNRRRQVCGLTPDRRGGKRWLVSNPSVARVEEAMELWRIAACASMGDNASVDYQEILRDFFWDLVSVYMEQPNGVRTLCDERLLCTQAGTVGAFDDEEDLLRRITRACDDDDWLDRRLSRLGKEIQALPSNTKLVVFCSRQESADEVFRYLKAHHLNPIRHEVESDDELEFDKPEAWTKFLSDPSARIIVCDARAEEGINLQGGNKAVIHFDLPMQPNRIEQRMGRVDRYGAGMQVQSFALLDEESMLQTGWFTVLSEGWGVFNQSISSLQYLVEDELGKLKDYLLLNGADAFHELAARLAGEAGLVATELKLIDQQDALDELSPLPESETEDLVEVDHDWKNIRRSMLYWIADTLLFEAVPVHARENGNGIDQPFRFHYHPPGSQMRAATLIPLSGFLDQFLGAIDYEAPGSRASEPRSFIHAAHRGTAVRRGARLLRYGDEFVEAVKSFSDADERGRSFAMWRQIHEGYEDDDIKMCFRFDFVIESRLDDASEVIGQYGGIGASHLSDAAIARRGDALFQPFLIHAWVDEDGRELSPEFVARFLEAPYSKEGADNHIDKNLDAEHFRGMKRLAPEAFVNWHDRCHRMQESAREIVLRRVELAERKEAALKRAKAEDEIRYAQLRTRIQSLMGLEAEAERTQLQVEMRINKALYAGIQDPTVKLDVAGVVFLTNQPVTVIDRANVLAS